MDKAFRENILFLETTTEIESFAEVVDGFFRATLTSLGIQLSATAGMQDVITTQPLFVRPN